MARIKRYDNSTIKKVDRDRWVEFCDMLADGNRGRKVSIEVIQSGADSKVLIENASLMAVVCDPKTKGNDIVIETGEKQVSYAHTIAAPTELQKVQDENGELMALEIKDEDDTQTFLHFVW